MRELTQTATNTLPAPVAEFQSISRPNDYTDIVSCTSAKLRPFASKYGSSALEAILSGVLLELSRLMRFTITGDMITAASEIIISEWPDTKLSDFLLFKKKVLSGEVGGKMFGNDTRTMCELWREYYAKREDTMAAAREAKFAEEKRQYQESYIASSDKIKDLYAGLRQSASQQRLEQSYREKVRTMTLEEICAEAKLDYSVVMENIKEQARTDWADSGMELTFELYLDVLTHKILLEARKNVDALGRYV